MASVAQLYSHGSDDDPWKDYQNIDGRTGAVLEHIISIFLFISFKNEFKLLKSTDKLLLINFTIVTFLILF